MSTSLSRAFTTRRGRKTSDVAVDVLQRSPTTKHPFASGTIRHQKISGPLELISTTNMLSYNAPDIYPRGRSSTTSSAASSVGSSSTSGSRSETGSPSSVTTAFTSPETSSIENSPTTSSPKPNHLSCYFGSPGQASDEEAPMIPQRAVSHTKKSAEYIARTRSMSRISSRKNSISSRITSPKHSISTSRSSINMFSPNPDIVEHPFGNELAQVSELAEEYGLSKTKLTVVDEEELELTSRGLLKFGAEEYMSELQGLFINAFGDMPRMSAVWI